MHYFLKKLEIKKINQVLLGLATRPHTCPSKAMARVQDFFVLSLMGKMTRCPPQVYKKITRHLC